MNSRPAAGIAFFVGAVEFLIGMHLAEFMYPEYSVSENYISDLGATCRNSQCVVQQPSATIFNVSVILLGLLILAGVYFLRREYRGMLLPVLLALAGIGAVGVGAFPETAGIVHSIFSLIAFLFGGLAAVASYRILSGPFRFLSVILGVIALVALSLYVPNIYLGLGPGGMERMIAYPILFWGVGFGGHLMTKS